MPKDTIQSVLERHSSHIMSLPGVVGVAEGEGGGESCVRVYVTRKTPEIVGRIPEQLEGYAIVVEETGEFRAVDA